MLADMKADHKVSLHSISYGKLLIEETCSLSEGVTDMVLLMVGVHPTAACDKFVENICCCFTDMVLLMVGVHPTAACDKFVENICCCCVSHIIV